MEDTIPIFTGETLHIDCPHFPEQPFSLVSLEFDFLLQQFFIFVLEDISILQECFPEPDPHAYEALGIKKKPNNTINMR